MTPHENIPVAMLLALMPPTQPKEFCTSHRHNQWGHRVTECSFHAVHANDHRDVHTGDTWT